MHRLLCLLLLICLPLHSFAAQIAAIGLASAGAQHQLAHSVDLHHHHHDDGEVHYDDSDASVDHTHEHAATVQLLLPAPASLIPPLQIASLADPAEPVSHIPHPYLDDPQRPPAFAPGLTAGG